MKSGVQVFRPSGVQAFGRSGCSSVRRRLRGRALPPLSGGWGGSSRIRRGFTLIELMVVLVILSILAAVIIPRVVNRGEDARRAKAVSDVESIGTALDMYAADNGRYPTSEQGLEALRELPIQAPLPSAWNGPYLKKTLMPDPWGHAYQYQSPGTHNPATYDLWSFGADGQPGGGGNDADITSWE